MDVARVNSKSLDTARVKIKKQVFTNRFYQTRQKKKKKIKWGEKGRRKKLHKFIKKKGHRINEWILTRNRKLLSEPYKADKM